MVAVNRERTEGEGRLWAVKISGSVLERCDDVSALLFTINVAMAKSCPLSEQPQFLHW